MLQPEHMEALQPEADLLEPLPPEHLPPEHEQLEPLLDPLPEPQRQAGPFDDELGEPALFPAPVRDAAPVDPFAEPELQPPQSRASIELEEEPLLEAPAGPSRRAAPSQRRLAVDEDEALARLDSLSLDDLPELPAQPGDPLEEALEIDHRPRHGGAAGGSTAGSGREEPTFDHALEPEAGGSDEGQSRDLRKKMTARGLRNLGGMPSAPEEQGGAVRQEAEVPRAVLDESLLTPEDQRFVDEVRSRARMAMTQNAYARLGVSPGATNDQIKSAYLGLAKRFHPDRASGPGLGAMQPELQALFGQLKDSYDAISTAELRTRYDAKQKAGGKPNSRRDEATLALKMGDVLFKKRDFEGAIQKLRRAVDLEATGDAWRRWPGRWWRTPRGRRPPRKKRPRSSTARCGPPA